jgi:hypothetical protein
VNKVIDSVVWVAALLCLGVAVALFVFVQDGRGQAATMGCVALVLAIIGASRRRIGRGPHDR